LGFDSDFKPMLLMLGSIRNKFSHNLHKKIDDEMVKNLHSVAHQTFRNSLAEFLNKLSSEGKTISSFHEAHPRDQFTALVLALWLVLCEAVNEAEDVSIV
jgi:hypothetical protein